MPSTSLTPVLTDLKKTVGIAGQVAVSVTTTYPGEKAYGLTFVGSVYGGPVFMVTPTGEQVLVDSPERYGDTLDTRWVERFFGPR